MSLYSWLQRREYGMPSRFGDMDVMMKRVYKSLTPFVINTEVITDSGAIFNMEFSPDGTVLAVACEKKAIALYDGINGKETHKIPDAHTDNVNCIKFLNGHMFATGSDDTSVALWDLRNMKSKVRSLFGHSNWVKNVEYSQKDNLLISSGFDGSIITWDINSHTEQGLVCQKVFHISGLMRCVIAPDGNKLILCTTGGYLMIIHNLNLATLYKDLAGFRPSIYRLMQMGHQYIPQAAKFDHVFSKKQEKNRVELVTDFPKTNDAEVILALQVHPQSHCFLSRNLSYNEQTEWSCVHDLSEEPGDITETAKEPPTEKNKRKRKLIDSEENTENNVDATSTSSERLRPHLNHRRLRLHAGLRALPQSPSVITRSTPPATTRPTTSASPASSVLSIASSAPSRPEIFVPDIWAAEVTLEERVSRQNRDNNTNSVTGYNFVYAISSGVLPALSAARSQNIQTLDNLHHENASTEAANDEIQLYPHFQRSNSSSSSSQSSSDSPPYSNGLRPRVRALHRPICKDHQIFQNPKKLMYYIEESNKGRGFIKEPSFSSDGRIICSPYINGVRLLSFNEDCSEYPTYWRLQGAKPTANTLVTLRNISLHSDVVLCAKFSPRAPILVTGCRKGEIIWFNPVL